MILALDLGTEMGFAYGSLRGRVESCGNFSLGSPSSIKADRKTRMDRRLDSRAPYLYEWLKVLHFAHDFKWITFEDVQFSSTTQQTQLWATWRTVVWLFAAHYNIQTECCPVQTLKKFATGRGGADKDLMAIALSRIYSNEFFLEDGKIHWIGHAPKLFLSDDGVDAVHLLNWSRSVLANTEKRNG